MVQFMILYSATQSSHDAAMAATPEEVQASMARWIAWRDEASKQVKVDFGLPMQAVAHVTSEGVGPSDSLISGHSMLEGDKDTVVELLKTHPHLLTSGASIDLYELIPLEAMTGK